MKVRLVAKILLCLLVIVAPPSSRSWLASSSHDLRRRRCARASSRCFLAANKIDYQADCYGRGVQHLSADLEPGDVVVYQVGTWYVDGVAVGDGTPPAFAYALVDTLQIVWSHNCEHGLVRGLALTLLQQQQDDNDNSSSSSTLKVHDFDTMIEFGPEQLLARIPVQQQEAETFVANMKLSDDVWQTKASSSES